MKKINLLIFICFITVFVNSNFAQGWEWVKSEGSTSLDEAERVAVDNAGNVIVVGKFSGSYMFENTDDEGLSVETDGNGNILICGYFQGNASFGNLSLAGTSTPDIFVAKYNASGTIQWINGASGPDTDRAKGVSSDTKGNVLVTGFYKDTCHFNSNTLYSPGDDNVFLAKYSPAGNFLWVADGGGPYSAWASSVSTDDYDNSYLTGSFKSTAVFGNDTIVSFGGNDVFLLKADSTGNWVFARNNGGIDNDYGNGLEVDDFNRVAITGSFFQTVFFAPSDTMTSNGAKDGFAAYYDANGNCIWARNMGGLSSDKGIEISSDKDGNIYVSGYVEGIAQFNSIIDTTAGGADIFIAKYDQQGTIQYVDLAGGTSNDYGKGIQVDMQGVAYISGYYEGTAYFGQNSATSAGSRDLFVTKYYDGSPLFTQQPQNISICEGDSVTLSVQVVGPGTYNYLWFDDAGSILGAVNSSYTFIAADTNYSGKYFCMVNNTYGAVTSDTALITVYPKPYVYLGSDTAILSNDSIIFDLGSSYTSYLWSTGDTTSSIKIYAYQIIPGAMELSVTVTNSNGCSSADTVMIGIIINDINDLLHSEGVHIYPNPANDKLVINTKRCILKTAEIFNTSGKLCKSVDLKEIYSESLIISTSELPPGLYYILLKAEKEVFVRKIIIK